MAVGLGLRPVLRLGATPGEVMPAQRPLYAAHVPPGAPDGVDLTQRRGDRAPAPAACGPQRDAGLTMRTALGEARHLPRQLARVPDQRLDAPDDLRLDPGRDTSLGDGSRRQRYDTGQQEHHMSWPGSNQSTQQWPPRRVKRRRGRRALTSDTTVWFHSPDTTV